MVKKIAKVAKVAKRQIVEISDTKSSDGDIVIPKHARNVKASDTESSDDDITIPIMKRTISAKKCNTVTHIKKNTRGAKASDTESSDDDVTIQITKKVISAKKCNHATHIEKNTKSAKASDTESSDDDITIPIEKKIAKKATVPISNNNTSPLRYPGGKTRACKKLCDILEEHFAISRTTLLVSPFFGCGSYEFHIQNKHNIRVAANDKFQPLINFWNNAKNNNASLYTNLCNMIDVSKEQFIEYRNDIMELNDDSLKQATYYFVINRCSFSGATLSGGFSSEASSKRFTQSSIERVKSLDLSDFEFYNMDFTNFLNKKFKKDRIIFLDPPYYLEKGSTLYGKNGDMHENFDHGALYKKISKMDKWMMTYNDCEYIRDLYADFEIIDVDWSYGMKKSRRR